jgi:hypothetical protein
MLMVIAILPALVLTMARSPSMCSVGELKSSPGYSYRVDRIRQFVDSASVIVRAKALAMPASDTHVRFEVLEHIRGSDSLTRVELRGVLVARDDFNGGTVPYQMVRSAGQHGDCYAQEYRAGAEYLLILEPGVGGLSAHWKPLAPFNEQLRGADDPWLLWVREAARRPPGST